MAKSCAITYTSSPSLSPRSPPPARSTRSRRMCLRRVGHDGRHVTAPDPSTKNTSVQLSGLSNKIRPASASSNTSEQWKGSFAQARLKVDDAGLLDLAPRRKVMPGYRVTERRSHRADPPETVINLEMAATYRKTEVNLDENGFGAGVSSASAATAIAPCSPSDLGGDPLSRLSRPLPYNTTAHRLKCSQWTNAD